MPFFGLRRQLAHSSLLAGRLQAAYEHSRAAAAAEPDAADAWWLLAETNSRLGYDDEAVAARARWQALCPDPAAPTVLQRLWRWWRR